MAKITLRMRRLKDLYCEYNVDLHRRASGDDYISCDCGYLLHPCMERLCGQILNVVHSDWNDRAEKRYVLYEKEEYGEAGNHCFSEYLFEEKTILPKDGV